MVTRETHPPSPAPPALTARRRAYGDRAFTAMAAVSGASMAAVMVLMVVVLAEEAWPAVRAFGPAFLVRHAWNPVTEEFGALPAVYGTVVSSLLALLFAVPVSIGVAVFLTEVAPGWLRAPVSFLVELLAAIPSVVYGLWGLFVLVPWIRDPFQTTLSEYLGFLPLFAGPPLGVGMLTAGLLLAIMVTPIITAVTRDVLAAVPQDQREAALALGATRWEAIRHAVLPYARSGLIGAVILGLGRAVGETMAVLMVVGNAYQIDPSLLAPGQTMAGTIAAEFREAASDVYRAALIELGLVLFAVTLLINVLARILVWRIAGQHGTTT